MIRITISRKKEPVVEQESINRALKTQLALVVAIVALVSIVIASTMR